MGTDFGVSPIFFQAFSAAEIILPFPLSCPTCTLKPEHSDQVIQHCASANSRAAPDLFPTQTELAGQDCWEKMDLNKP